MNIIILTRSALNNDDNMGNTIAHLFYGHNDVSIHSIFMRSESYKNNICKTVYQIPEGLLINKFLKFSECGCEIKNIKNAINIKTKNREENVEKERYDFAKKYNLSLFWFFREFIWSFSKWKNKTFEEYLVKTKPDVIFMPSFNCWYPYKILEYVERITHAKIILYHVDDNYSLKQFHISPFYWIYRLNLRRWIKKSVRMSVLNYCISDMQVSEYEKSFGVKCKLLQKPITTRIINKNNTMNYPLKLVFTGNLSSGRWKTLELIGKALSKINKNCIRAQLFIYSGTLLTPRMRKALEIKNSVIYMGKVPASAINKIQHDADILIHAESFSFRDKLEVRLSFSTKIIDYLSSGKCILAVGPADIASIDFFVKNNIGYVICNKNNLAENINKFINDNKKIAKVTDRIIEFQNEMFDKNIKRENFIDEIRKVLL